MPWSSSYTKVEWIIMKEIKLEELPKSKEFTEHIQIADGLSKETGFEHGFIFCKPNNKIIVDTMCVGDNCSVAIGYNECGTGKQQEKFDNFHTHPRGEPEFSVQDITSSIIGLSSFNKQNIICVKAIDNNNVLCEKYKYPDDYKILAQAIDIKVEYETSPIPKNENETKEKLKKIMKPKSIKFDSKTGIIL